jgi:hypothetical protein
MDIAGRVPSAVLGRAGSGLGGPGSVGYDAQADRSNCLIDGIDQVDHVFYEDEPRSYVAATL